MMIGRSRLTMIAGLLGLTGLASGALAQAVAWKPEKNIELIVGAAPVGSADQRLCPAWLRLYSTSILPSVN